jgi:hypothetical protein
LHSDYPFGIFKLSSLTTFGRQVGKEITKLKKKSLILRFQTSKYNVKGRKKKYKRTNNDLQNIHIKLKIE